MKILEPQLPCRESIYDGLRSAGYRDEEIMRQWRWNSNAFKVYCKTGRANRLKEQRDIARTLSNI